MRNVIGKTQPAKWTEKNNLKIEGEKENETENNGQTDLHKAMH